jgi:NADH-quinone oxidoreductase subunit I
MTTSRGYIALIEDKCTSCMLCVRECPTWCITLQARTELDPDALPVGGGRKERTRNVLETFEIDYGLCMYCGICVEVCPFDALEWQADPADPATSGRAELVHGIDELTREPGQS